MTDYLITYDLKEGNPDPHKRFLTEAEKEGLLYVWKGATYVNRLPNTTAWGVFDTAEEADNAFDRAISATSRAVGYSVKLEKSFRTKMTDNSARSDRRKKPETKWSGKTSFETSRLHQLNDPYFK